MMKLKTHERRDVLKEAAGRLEEAGRVWLHEGSPPRESSKKSQSQASEKGNTRVLYWEGGGKVRTWKRR